MLLKSADAGNDHRREQWARLSGGTSVDATYAMIASFLREAHYQRGTLVDVGCGSGALREFVAPHCDNYIGTDLIRYESFPEACEFRCADLNESLPFPDSFAEVVIAAEVIEHLENPRALMRELVRITKPAGLILVTTPNQLSLLSLITLITRKRFAAFQDVDYPAHLTALLEADLLHIGNETGLGELSIVYSVSGRIPKTNWNYPRAMSRLWPRGLSDNLMLAGYKPSSGAES